VYVNDPLAMQFVYPLSLLGSIRAVFALRNMPDPAIPPNPRKYRMLFSVCRRVLFLSEDMASRWKAVAGNVATPQIVTYSIVDDSMIGQVRQRDERRPFVLIPARVTSSKRQLDFIRFVAPALVAAGVRVLFAGDVSPADSDYAKACRDAAAPLGEGVVFLGFRQDLAELYSRASLVIIASRLEGLARAMIEAMACGCPVVSFDVCSAMEMLGTGGGLVVPEGDWCGMRDAILALCADPSRLDAMSVVARSEASRFFRSEIVAERYEAAFDLAAANQ
jgi:glycosyltransferase involved in cell wall biosynthesis